MYSRTNQRESVVCSPGDQGGSPPKTAQPRDGHRVHQRGDGHSDRSPGHCLVPG